MCKYVFREKILNVHSGASNALFHEKLCFQAEAGIKLPKLITVLSEVCHFTCVETRNWYNWEM